MIVPQHPFRAENVHALPNFVTKMCEKWQKILTKMRKKWHNRP